MWVYATTCALSAISGDWNLIICGSAPSQYSTTMSYSKDFVLDLLNDLVLGAFARAPASGKLDHAVRYLSTWNGTEYAL